jgi:hypothetical protein
MSHERTVYCLHVFAVYQLPLSKKFEWDQYKKWYVLFLTFGTVSGKDLVNQKACLGSLLAWGKEPDTVEPSSRVVNFFNEKYTLQRRLNQTELDHFLSILSC